MSRVCDNPLYGRWNAMKQRCFNETNPKYPRYGGRGITIADEWQDFHVFESWAKENGYQKELTLDRINTDGNYEPSNCRWVNQSIQQNNRNNNRIIEYEGKEYTLAELSDLYDINRATLAQRLDKGMSVKKALNKKMNFNYILVEHEGETKTLKQWCEQLGLPYKTIHARVSRGWEPKEALKKPVRKGNYKRVVST